MATTAKPTKKSPVKKAAPPAPAPEAKPAAEAKDDRLIKVALKTVSNKAAKHRRSKDGVRKDRIELDDAIFTARQKKATYREIAESADVSTAWVQASLERSGYVTKPR